MTAPSKPRDIADLDVRTAELVQRIAEEQVKKSAAKLRWLLAHPEAVATAKHATAGEAAEQRHWLYDADPDSTVPAFPYPTAQETP